jgi:hypothetical protein
VNQQSFNVTPAVDAAADVKAGGERPSLVPGKRKKDFGWKVAWRCNHRGANKKKGNQYQVRTCQSVVITITTTDKCYGYSIKLSF